MILRTRVLITRRVRRVLLPHREQCRRSSGSFLTLLVAQLKNQDPTNPMQNNELTTQLAQISTVSGIEKLNTTLGSVSGQINSAQSLQAASLIGHGVMIPGTTILAGTSTTEGNTTTTTTPFALSCSRRRRRLPQPYRQQRHGRGSHY